MIMFGFPVQVRPNQEESSLDVRTCCVSLRCLFAVPYFVSLTEHNRCVHIAASSLLPRWTQVSRWFAVAHPLPPGYLSLYFVGGCFVVFSGDGIVD